MNFQSSQINLETKLESINQNKNIFNKKNQHKKW